MDEGLLGRGGRLQRLKHVGVMLDLGTFILYEKPRAFAADYEHANETTQATRRKAGVTAEAQLHRNLRVNAEQVLALWPKTRKGSPLEAAHDTVVSV
jgi:hypothetical protein